MSNDDLLRALGRLSARQAEEDARPLPPELAAPASAVTRQHLADQALAALGARSRDVTAARPAPASWVSRLFARRALLLATPALGVAAAALVFTRGRSTTPLPGYSLQLTGGVATLRGDAPAGTAPLQLAEGSRVELLLRPERAVAADGLQVQLYWARGDVKVPWTVTPEISSQGAVRVIGAAPRPFGAGQGELVAVIARTGAATLTLRTSVRWR